MPKKNIHCPAEQALKAFSGRWKLLILREVCSGPRRFGQLRRALDGITQKVLTSQLRQMEADGLVQRRAIPGRVPQVEYSATAEAATLKPAIDSLHAWGEKRGQKP